MLCFLIFIERNLFVSFFRVYCLSDSGFNARVHLHTINSNNNDYDNNNNNNNNNNDNNNNMSPHEKQKLPLSLSSPVGGKYCFIIL